MLHPPPSGFAIIFNDADRWEAGNSEGVLMKNLGELVYVSSTVHWYDGGTGTSPARLEDVHIDRLELDDQPLYIDLTSLSCWN